MGCEVCMVLTVLVGRGIGRATGLTAVEEVASQWFMVGDGGW